MVLGVTCERVRFGGPFVAFGLGAAVNRLVIDSLLFQPADWRFRESI
jgi:hypothetical protein